MIGVIAKVYAAQDPAFDGQDVDGAADISVYRGIDLEELERNGPEGILSDYAKRRFGLDRREYPSIGGTRGNTHG